MAKRVPEGQSVQIFNHIASTYVVGESAREPGSVHVTQYGAELVGPLAPEEAKRLGLALLTAANALGAR